MVKNVFASGWAHGIASKYFIKSLKGKRTHDTDEYNFLFTSIYVKIFLTMCKYVNEISENWMWQKIS